MSIRSGVIAVLGAAGLAICGGCSHLPSTAPSGLNEDRYPSKAQVVELTGCQKLDGLRRLERALFHQGFLREVMREDEPVAYELVDRLISGEARLVAYRKTDFESLGRKTSQPYREIVNRYELSACEEPGGALYLIVLRRDPDPQDRFLGARLGAAIDASGCAGKPVAAPRELGLFSSAAEDDLLRHVRRGLCQAYALGK